MMEKRQLSGLLLVLFGVCMVASNLLSMFLSFLISTYLLYMIPVIVTAMFLIAGLLLVVQGSENRAHRIGGAFIAITGTIWTAGNVIYLLDLIVPFSIPLMINLFLSDAAITCVLGAGIAFVSLSKRGTKSRVVGIMLVVFGIIAISLSVYWNTPIHTLFIATLPALARDIVYIIIISITISAYTFVIIAGVYLKSKEAE